MGWVGGGMISCGGSWIWEGGGGHDQPWGDMDRGGVGQEACSAVGVMD